MVSRGGEKRRKQGNMRGKEREGKRTNSSGSVYGVSPVISSPKEHRKAVRKGKLRKRPVS